MSVVRPSSSELRFLFEPNPAVFRRHNVEESRNFDPVTKQEVIHRKESNQWERPTGGQFQQYSKVSDEKLTVAPNVRQIELGHFEYLAGHSFSAVRSRQAFEHSQTGSGGRRSTVRLVSSSTTTTVHSFSAPSGNKDVVRHLLPSPPTNRLTTTLAPPLKPNGIPVPLISNKTETDKDWQLDIISLSGNRLDNSIQIEKKNLSKNGSLSRRRRPTRSNLNRNMSDVVQSLYVDNGRGTEMNHFLEPRDVTMEEMHYIDPSVTTVKKSSARHRHHLPEVPREPDLIQDVKFRRPFLLQDCQQDVTTTSNASNWLQEARKRLRKSTSNLSSIDTSMTSLVIGVNDTDDHILGQCPSSPPLLTNGLSQVCKSADTWNGNGTLTTVRPWNGSSRSNDIEELNGHMLEEEEEDLVHCNGGDDVQELPETFNCVHHQVPSNDDRNLERDLDEGPELYGYCSDSDEEECATVVENGGSSVDIHDDEDSVPVEHSNLVVSIPILERSKSTSNLDDDETIEAPWFCHPTYQKKHSKMEICRKFAQSSFDLNCQALSNGLEVVPTSSTSGAFEGPTTVRPWTTESPEDKTKLILDSVKWMTDAAADSGSFRCSNETSEVTVNGESCSLIAEPTPDGSARKHVYLNGFTDWTEETEVATGSSKRSFDSVVVVAANNFQLTNPRPPHYDESHRITLNNCVVVNGSAPGGRSSPPDNDPTSFQSDVNHQDFHDSWMDSCWKESSSSRQHVDSYSMAFDDEFENDSTNSLGSASRSGSSSWASLDMARKWQRPSNNIEHRVQECPKASEKGDKDEKGSSNKFQLRTVYGGGREEPVVTGDSSDRSSWKLLEWKIEQGKNVLRHQEQPDWIKEAEDKHRSWLNLSCCLETSQQSSSTTLSNAASWLEEVKLKRTKSMVEPQDTVLPDSGTVGCSTGWKFVHLTDSDNLRLAATSTEDASVEDSTSDEVVVSSGRSSGQSQETTGSSSRKSTPVQQQQQKDVRQFDVEGYVKDLIHQRRASRSVFQHPRSGQQQPRSKSEEPDWLRHSKQKSSRSVDWNGLGQLPNDRQASSWRSEEVRSKKTTPISRKPGLASEPGGGGRNCPVATSKSGSSSRLSRKSNFLAIRDEPDDEPSSKVNSVKGSFRRFQDDDDDIRTSAVFHQNRNSVCRRRQTVYGSEPVPDATDKLTVRHHHQSVREVEKADRRVTFHIPKTLSSPELKMEEEDGGGAQFPEWVKIAERRKCINWDNLGKHEAALQHESGAKWISQVHLKPVNCSNGGGTGCPDDVVNRKRSKNVAGYGGTASPLCSTASPSNQGSPPAPLSNGSGFEPDKHSKWHEEEEEADAILDSGGASVEEECPPPPPPDGAAAVFYGDDDVLLLNGEKESLVSSESLSISLSESDGSDVSSSGGFADPDGSTPQEEESESSPPPFWISADDTNEEKNDNRKSPFDVRLRHVREEEVVERVATSSLGPSPPWSVRPRGRSNVDKWQILYKGFFDDLLEESVAATPGGVTRGQRSRGTLERHRKRFEFHHQQQLSLPEMNCVIPRDGHEVEIIQLPSSSAPPGGGDVTAEETDKPMTFVKLKPIHKVESSDEKNVLLSRVRLTKMASRIVVKRSGDDDGDVTGSAPGGGERTTRTSNVIARNKKKVEPEVSIRDAIHQDIKKAVAQREHRKWTLPKPQPEVTLAPQATVEGKDGGGLNKPSWLRELETKKSSLQHHQTSGTSGVYPPPAVSTPSGSKGQLTSSQRPRGGGTVQDQRRHESGIVPKDPGSKKPWEKPKNVCTSGPPPSFESVLSHIKAMGKERLMASLRKCEDSCRNQEEERPRPAGTSSVVVDCQRMQQQRHQQLLREIIHRSTTAISNSPMTYSSTTTLTSGSPSSPLATSDISVTVSAEKNNRKWPSTLKLDNQVEYHQVDGDRTIQVHKRHLVSDVTSESKVFSLTSKIQTSIVVPSTSGGRPPRAGRDDEPLGSNRKPEMFNTNRDMNQDGGPEVAGSSTTDNELKSPLLLLNLMSHLNKSCSETNLNRKSSSSVVRPLKINTQEAEVAAAAAKRSAVSWSDLSRQQNGSSNEPETKDGGGHSRWRLRSISPSSPAAAN